MEVGARLTRVHVESGVGGCARKPTESNAARQRGDPLQLWSPVDGGRVGFVAVAASEVVVPEVLEQGSIMAT